MSKRKANTKDRQWKKCEADTRERLMQLLADCNSVEAQEVFRLLFLLYQLDQLYRAFKKASGNIEHAGGVADLLKITRGAVYLRCKLVGLKPEDFRGDEVTLDGLLAKSRISQVFNEVVCKPLAVAER